MQKPYKSDVSAAIHKTAEELYEYGIIDEKSMPEFDVSCLATSPMGENGLIRRCVTPEDSAQQHTANIYLRKMSGG